MKTWRIVFFILVLGSLTVFALGLVLHAMSRGIGPADNDLWLVQNLAENNKKLSDVSSFVSVDDNKTDQDKKLGFETSHVAVELFEFRLIRQKRLMILRTYAKIIAGEIKNPTVVDVGQIKKVATYGPVGDSLMVLAVNREVDLPPTDLGKQSSRELTIFYGDYLRAFRTGGQLKTNGFVPEDEISKLKKYSYTHIIGSHVQSLSYSMIVVGMNGTALSLFGFVCIAIFWHSSKKELLTRGETSDAVYKKICKKIPAPSLWRFIFSKDPVAAIKAVKISRLKMAEQVGEQETRYRNIMEREKKRLLAEIAISERELENARTLPARRWQETMDAIKSYATKEGLLPEVERLVEKAKNAEWQEAKEFLQEAIGLQRSESKRMERLNEKASRLRH